MKYTTDKDKFIDGMPHIPVRPVLSWGDFGLESSHCATVLDAGQAKFTLNARTALAHALLHAKIGRGNSVLLPAYHCPAMVSPLAWLGVEPVFYPIRPNTSVDVNVLSRLVRPDTRAVLAAHYFGFIQDMRPLREFCDTHGLVLIEDCAHAFFGSVDGQSLGRQGDYAIASIMKFLPINEGGCLVSSRRSLDAIEMRSGGLFFQMKSALNTVEMACHYGRLLGFGHILAIKDWLWRSFKQLSGRGHASPTAFAAGEEGNAEYVFDPSKLDTRMSWASSAIMRSMSMSHACTKRRANYQRLLDGLSNIPGGKPLFADLREGVYPQVFPMVMDDPKKAFPALKQRGVPIIRFGEFRWKGVDGAVCPVSDELSRRVFQFPCHQSLTRKEMDWLVETVRSVLAELEVW